MEILLPEKNYSLDEINTTLYTAVKGYIENIRLLKLANARALRYGEGDEVTVTFPTLNQFEFDWSWDKDYDNSGREINTGDDLILKLDIKPNQSLEELAGLFNVQVLISAAKVKESKKNNELGYVFKSIIEIYSNDDFVAKVSTQTGLYASNFLSDISWETDDETTTYSYEDTQVQQDRSIIKQTEGVSMVHHIPKGQTKGINVLGDTKLGLLMYTPITIIPIRGNSPAFTSFVKQMKRN